MVNVDFEWFDPQPAVDFHGLKNLLRQLFDNDAQIFDMSALADLILSQPTLGSTVKVDGNESDPYAFLSVLNLQEHKVRKLPRFYNLMHTNNRRINP
jgi:protein BCP1